MVKPHHGADGGVGSMVHDGAVVGGDSRRVCRAAVISANHEDEIVSLLVHHPLYDERLERVAAGNGPGFYHWPEFVPPRAPATEPPLQFPPGSNEP